MAQRLYMDVHLATIHKGTCYAAADLLPAHLNISAGVGLDMHVALKHKGTCSVAAH
jgi:hypothetical protein